MDYIVGETLKSFREYNHLSLTQLADGICTVEELQAFEKGDVYPNLDVINKLSERLNIEVAYFFNVVSENSLNYPSSVIQLIEKYKRERNYKEIHNIVQKEIDSPYYIKPRLKQYLKWHEGICFFYNNKDIEGAVQTLENAISMTNPNRDNLSEREVEILNSIAILYYEVKNYNEAINLFFEALHNLDKLPKVIDTTIKIKVLFGLSQVLTELGRYEESIKYCQLGINLCINKETLYCLGEFHYQMGENLVKLGDIEEGKVYLDECLHLLHLGKKYKLEKIMKREIEKLIKN